MRNLILALLSLNISFAHAMDLPNINTRTCQAYLVSATAPILSMAFGAINGANAYDLSRQITRINAQDLIRLQGELTISQPFSSKKLTVPNFHLILAVQDRTANFLQLPDLLWSAISTNVDKVAKAELADELKHMIHIINASNSFDANTVHFKINFMDHVNGERTINFSQYPDWSLEKRNMNLSQLAEFVQDEFNRVPLKGIIPAHSAQIKKIENSIRRAKAGTWAGILGFAVSGVVIKANQFSYEDCY